MKRGFKHFTAFAVLMLKRAGKLRLEDRIQNYLSGLPDYGATITVANLLRDASNRVIALDLSEPENLGKRTIRFVKQVECR